MVQNVQVPFSLQLRDFIMERPGTDNPSSYASEVTLVDAAGEENFQNLHE